MKLTVLVDNHTLIDRYFKGEPGVSYYIEVADKRILFDLGYSDLFLENGRKLGVQFEALDAVVISHSHLDHTWGMEPLVKHFNERLMEGLHYKRPTLIAHPEIFRTRSFNGRDEFGMNISSDTVFKYLEDGLSKSPVWITEKLVFLGEIPRENDFEALSAIGDIVVSGKQVPDFSIDDSALCYMANDGLVIITGCSHSGICNIIEYAKKVCHENRILDIIGGFHLLDPEAKQLEETVRYLSKQSVAFLHACHCTDLRSKIALSTVVALKEVGVGLKLVY